MMIITITAFLKFLHVILAMMLLGIVLLNCLSRMKNSRRVFLQIGLLAGITGTLLIYPRHFTLHTPWIQAAFLLLGLFLVLVFFFAPKSQIAVFESTSNHPKAASGWLWYALTPILALILMIIIHDAVMKTAF